MSTQQKQSRRMFLGKATMAVCSLGTGLAIAETASKSVLGKTKNPFSHNPVIAEQAKGTAIIFDADHKLGHCLFDNSFIGVYKKDFVDFKTIVKEAKTSGKPIILNLGDSSTSGWNSDVITENRGRQKMRLPILSPFYTYPTYSDLLAEGSDYYVINAGVPGYGSLQGLRYLNRILDGLAEFGMMPYCVTIYFGNNDSAWNGNIEDKYQIADAKARFYLVALMKRVMNRMVIVTRSSPSDYEDNLIEMVQLCRFRGIAPILIEPAIPKFWHPGLRGRGMLNEVNDFLAKTEMYAVTIALKRAMRIYQKGVDAYHTGEIDIAERDFTSAQNLDFLVPRIKPDHREKFRAVADKLKVPFVSVQSNIPLDDREYFIDYCHPVEPANRMIARALLEII